MKIEKSGSFIGVRIIKDNTGIYSKAYFKFKDGIYSVNICENTTLSSIIEKYDIGVANMGVKFSYTDYNKMIYFDCYIWDCEDNILQVMIMAFDEDTKKYINNLLKDIQPTCKIDNIGFSSNMNILYVVGNAPDIMTREINFNKDEWVVPNFHNQLTQISKIELDEKVVVSYFNNWNNEWWNGPQNYGGISQIGVNFINSVFEDYDFSLKNEIFQNREMIWDENTIIDLKGNQCNGITISCCLKDIGIFKGIIGSEAINSGIVTDIENLMDIEYTTHEEYLKKYPSCSIRLITIEKISEYFDSYRKMLSSRYQAIIQDTELLNGEKYQNDECLPF